MRLLMVGFAAGGIGCVSSDPWAAYESVDPQGNIFVQGYGDQRPRYGHGGTESPSARRAREEQERRIAAREESARREQARLARIEQENRREELNWEVAPPDSLADDTPELPEGVDDIVASVDEPEPLREAPPEPKPRPEPTPKPVPSQEPLSYGRPVPGKPGMVYSPYSPDAGYVDVRGIAPGTKVKCPYTKKLFRVP